MADIERGTSLRAEAARSARQIARELTAGGMTRTERNATARFLREIADAITFQSYED